MNFPDDTQRVSARVKAPTILFRCDLFAILNLCCCTDLAVGASSNELLGD